VPALTPDLEAACGLLRHGAVGLLVARNVRRGDAAHGEGGVGGDGAADEALALVGGRPGRQRLAIAAHLPEQRKRPREMLLSQSLTRIQQLAAWTWLRS